MTDLCRDPIINVVHNSIKKGIRLTLDAECFGPTLVQVYSGIDTMAYLNMSEEQEDVKRQDFVDWCEKYVQFPCKEQLSGLDLYGARCGILHTYSISSKLFRDDKCRQLGYMDHSVPEILYSPKIGKSFLLVSIRGLVDAFFDGIDRFLVDLFADEKKAAVAEKRFRGIIHQFPFEEENDQPKKALDAALD